jgi:hypothetical protein
VKKNNYFFYFIFFVFLLGDECLQNWAEENSTIISDKNFHISVNINNSKLNFFYTYPNKFRLETSDYIIIADDIMSSKYIIESNKLLIDNADKKFNKRISQILDFNKMNRKLKLVDNNSYKVKNKLLIGDVYLYYSLNCKNIDSLYIKNEHTDMLIKNIIINPLNNIQIDSLFTFDLKSEDIEVYDFR